MNAHASAPSSNAQTALALAAAGLHIFPCGDDKRPIGKWRNESTNDISKVAHIWNMRPDALIGVDCGKSGIVVVDLDRHDETDGIDPFHELFGHPEDFGAPIVATPSNGAHIYFRAPDGIAIRNSASKLALGIDVRGDGGYVVGPGSTRRDGTGWSQGFGRDLAEAFENGTLPELPQAIVEAIVAGQVQKEPPQGGAPGTRAALPRPMARASALGLWRRWKASRRN